MHLPTHFAKQFGITTDSRTHPHTPLSGVLRLIQMPSNHRKCPGAPDRPRKIGPRIGPALPGALPTYAILIYRGIALPNSGLLPSLLFKINENQLALEAAIMELSNWVEQRGSADVADNVRGALDTIDKMRSSSSLRLRSW